MESILLLTLLAAAAAPSDGEVQLTIARDPYSSSDHATVCRVRAINRGGRRWLGKHLRFEARAFDGGAIRRERGRFGLELPPYGSLETIVAFIGRFDRFEVKLLPPPESDDADGQGKTRAKKGARKKRGRSGRRK